LCKSLTPYANAAELRLPSRKSPHISKYPLVIETCDGAATIGLELVNTQFDAATTPGV
jgi:hypothetical protein